MFTTLEEIEKKINYVGFDKKYNEYTEIILNIFNKDIISNSTLDNSYKYIIHDSIFSNNKDIIPNSIFSNNKSFIFENLDLTNGDILYFIGLRCEFVVKSSIMAEIYFVMAVQHNNNIDACINLIYIYINKKNYDLAEKYAKIGIDLNNTECFMLLGKLHIIQKKFNSAIQNFLIAIKHNDLNKINKSYIYYKLILTYSQFINNKAKTIYYYVNALENNIDIRNYNNVYKQKNKSTIDIYCYLSENIIDLYTQLGKINKPNDLILKELATLSENSFIQSYHRFLNYKPLNFDVEDIEQDTKRVKYNDKNEDIEQETKRVKYNDKNEDILLEK
jgi:tetratricopeptide (TPR) repeat protein